jgi:metal-responsive CopG/Arc/MetJ family transcriptional regulator
MKRVISISISEELIAKIDAARGLVPRSAAIEEKLKDNADGKSIESRRV